MTSFDSSYLDNTIIPNQSQDNWIRKPYLPVENRDIRSDLSTSGGRGLSFNKQKFVLMFSKVQNRFIWIDIYKARYHRMRNSIYKWAELTNLYYSGDLYRRVMLDLTYKKVGTWHPNDITEFVKKLRNKLGEKLVTYAWVAELQERGAIHYHMIVIVKRGTNIPAPDSSGLWKHGSSRRDTAKTVFYMVTYVGKEHQKNFSEFPCGARCFGIGLFEGLVRKQFRFDRLKTWEQQYYLVNQDWKKLNLERRKRKYENGWKKMYITEDYELVKAYKQAYEWMGITPSGP
jgi:hypothetical protein